MRRNLYLHFKYRMLIINIKINNTTSTNDLHAYNDYRQQRKETNMAEASHTKKILVLNAKSMLQVLYLKIFVLFVRVVVQKFFFLAVRARCFNMFTR